MSALPPGLADLAVDVATAAAALVRERATGHVAVTATKTSDIDVVTEVDGAAEALIRERILAARPDDALRGEEGDDHPGTSGLRWVVDPIDGTVNFLYGIGQYAVSVAVETEHDGEAVAGAVVDVERGIVYAAGPAADGTTVATRDGRPMAVRGPAPLAQRLLATGFSYRRDVRVAQTEALTRLLPRVRDVRRLGSCALDLCLVADGRLDGYLEEGVSPWDHAAGGLIARAAGARTLVLEGASGLDFLVCAPAHGFDELVEAALEAGFARRPERE